MDLSAKSIEVAVNPCDETRFKVLALTEAEGTEVESFKTTSGFKTFQAPEAKENITQVSHEYHVDSDNVVDLTKVDISLNFKDVVEDPSCKRVNGAELRWGSFSLFSYFTSHVHLFASATCSN